MKDTQGLLPDRRSLVERVAGTLTAEITAGRWKDLLPQERTLAGDCGVSRNTLRAALQRLRNQGLVTAVRGQGYRITGAASIGGRSAPTVNTVVLLAPDPLPRLRPALGLLIDELRVLLFKQGLLLEMHDGEHYRSGSPRLLAKLVARHPAVCWILMRANERAQRWFVEERIPCLVSGSVFPGIDLPSIDLDLRAVGAHAAGRLLGLGHRRLLLMMEGNSAGMGVCESGFREAVEKSPGASVTAIMHSSDVDDVRGVLIKQMARRPRPTGILVTNSYFYLTVSGVLHQLGLRVPQDVSLICTDSDHFLPYMVPRASHYEFSHQVFARKIAQKVGRIASGEPLPRAHTRLVPAFAAGGSLGRPPVG